MSILLTLSLLISIAFGRVTIDHLDKERVPDEYVITYHRNTTEELAMGHWDVMERYGVEIRHKYNIGFHKGFSGKITDQKVLEFLQDDPMIMAIEANVIFHLDQLDCDQKQSDAPSWGLSRISSRNPASGDYIYGINGKGVDVYIIDTGILITHEDFGGRASYGINYVTGEDSPEIADDWNGHGTHCAGTSVGTTYGVAKGANVVAVKVLNSAGSGTFDNVVAGVSFVPGDTERKNPKVSSMSLGAGGSYAALTTAVDNSVARGIPVVVAAGNSNADACNFTPAGILSAITVGSTADDDSRSSFSNWGRCVDIFAPGTLITSAWIGSDTASRTISGTSMACPHVAGFAAVLFEEDPTASPQKINDFIQSQSNKDRIRGPGTGSPNYLLWNGCRDAFK